MPESRPINNYPCSQADLYAVCSIGWNSYGENQADFEAFNTLYTSAYGTDAIAEIEAALNLPGFQERDEAQETLHIEMTKVHSIAITKWKSLRSYIKHSYPSDLQKPKIESAGYDHYSKAANKNWAETQLLLNAGQHFIDNNTADLTTGGMPATFATEYADTTSDFLGLYGKFTDAEQDSQEATDKKINANNAIYSKLIAMFEDAQIVFENIPSKRERFVFQLVYAMITRPTGGDSITNTQVLILGKVTDSETGNPISEASVNTTPNGSATTFSAVTDEGGNYELLVKDLVANTEGTLIINADALDYEPTVLPFDYKTGNKHEVNPELIPEVAP